jgi:hypothetical protein
VELSASCECIEIHIIVYLQYSNVGTLYSVLFWPFTFARFLRRKCGAHKPSAK